MKWPLFFILALILGATAQSSSNVKSSGKVQHKEKLKKNERKTSDTNLKKIEEVAEDDQEKLYVNFNQIKKTNTNDRGAPREKSHTSFKEAEGIKVATLENPDLNFKETHRKAPLSRLNKIAPENSDKIFSPKFSLNSNFEMMFRDINDGIYNLQKLLNDSKSDIFEDWGSQFEAVRQDFFRLHRLISDFVLKKGQEFTSSLQNTQTADDRRSLTQNKLASAVTRFKSLTMIDTWVDLKRNQWIEDMRQNDELANLVADYSNINSKICRELHEFLNWVPKTKAPIEIAAAAQNVLDDASKNLITNFEDVITNQTNNKSSQTADQTVVGMPVPRIYIAPKVVSTFETISDGAYNLQKALNESQDYRILTWGKAIKLAQEEQYGAFGNLYKLLSAQVSLFSESHDVQLRIQVVSLCIDSPVIKTFSDCSNVFRSHNLLDRVFQEKELREFASHFFGFKADTREKIHFLIVQDLRKRTQIAAREIRGNPEFSPAFYKYYVASNRLWNLLLDFMAGAEQINVSPSILEDMKKFMSKITTVTLTAHDLFTDQDSEAPTISGAQKIVRMYYK